MDDQPSEPRTVRVRPGRDVSPEVAAEHLRERVYGTVAVLARW